MMFALLLQAEWYNFHHSLVSDLPEIEECLYLTTTMEGKSFNPNINFFSQSLNNLTCEQFVFWEQYIIHSHNEKVAQQQVIDFLDLCNILCPSQSGFRNAHLTDTAVICVSDLILDKLSKGNYVGAVLVNLKKAFDTVAVSYTHLTLPTNREV